MLTLLPLLVISLLSTLFLIFPEQSNIMLSSARFFFGNTLGSYYIIIALTIFFTSLYLCMSNYGDIVLGEKNEKPKYSFRSWGTMMKTKRQRFSEACRPILGRHSDGILGGIIDLLAIFALLAGTATTFSVATPLMSTIIQTLFHNTAAMVRVANPASHSISIFRQLYEQYSGCQHYCSISFGCCIANNCFRFLERYK